MSKNKINFNIPFEYFFSPAIVLFKYVTICGGLLQAEEFNYMITYLDLVINIPSKWNFLSTLFKSALHFFLITNIFPISLD